MRKGDISKYQLGEPRVTHQSKRLYFAKNAKDQTDSVVVKNYIDQDQLYLNSMRTKFQTTHQRFQGVQENILEIKLWDLVQDPRTRQQNLYLIMEKMKDNLSDIIKERQKMSMKFTQTDMKTLVSDTYKGLVAIQKFRIAHMNLKPSNILVDFDGNYKIADIGHPNDMSLPQFIAPELGNLGNYSNYYESSNNGREETYRTDAFSYGAILFQAASLCDISEVEAIKGFSTGATNFLKEKYSEIRITYGSELEKIIKDLTSQSNRKNFVQISDLITLYLNSQQSSDIFCDSSQNAQSQFVSQLIPQQDEQSVIKEIFEEIYQQNGLKIREQLKSVAVYESEFVRVIDFEEILKKALKAKLKRDELPILVKHYDSGKGNNQINYIKFCDDFEQPYKQKENTVQELQKRFYQSFRIYFNTFEEFIAKYDANRNGIFDKNEMISIYKQWFQQVDSQQFNKLFQSFNPNSKNQIYFSSLQQTFTPFINEDLCQIIRKIAEAFERQNQTFELFISTISNNSK